MATHAPGPITEDIAALHDEETRIKAIALTMALKYYEAKASQSGIDSNPVHIDMLLGTASQIEAHLRAKR